MVQLVSAYSDFSLIEWRVQTGYSLQITDADIQDEPIPLHLRQKYLPFKRQNTISTGSHDHSESEETAYKVFYSSEPHMTGGSQCWSLRLQ